MSRNISIITINQFITNTADSIFQVILFWYVYDQTGSALSASLVTVVSFTIQIFLSPVIGVFSDRVNPLKAMHLAFGLLGIVGVIFLPIYIYMEFLILPYIYIAIVVHTICMILENSSKNRLVPLFVGDQNIIKTNGYITSTSNVAALLGTSMGGTLLTILSFSGVMLLHSGLYFIAAVLLLFLVRIVPPEKEKITDNSKISSATEKSSFLTELREGFKLLKTNRPLLKLIILSCVLNVAMINSSLLVVLVSEQYNGSAATFGLFSMFGVLSSILIGLVMGNLSRMFRAPILLTFGLLFSGGATLILGMSNIIMLGIILNMLVLASLSILRITFNSFLMIFVEDKFRGRAMSLAVAISAIVVPIVSLLGGYLSDKFSVGLVYSLSGAWILIWSLFPMIDKDIRSINFNKRKQDGQTVTL